MKQISLKYRIAMTMFALTGVMLAVLLWQVQRMQDDDTSVEQAADETVIMDILGELSRFALIKSEYSDLDHYFSMVSRNPHVVKIIVADSTNRVVMSTDTGLLGLALPELQDREATRWRTRKLTNTAGTQGLLAVEFSNADLLAARKRRRTWAIVVALVSMTLIALVSVIMGAALTRRLAVLSWASKRIGEGEFGTRVNMEGEDEVSMLGKTIDRMARKIKTTMEDLHAAEMKYRTLVEQMPAVTYVASVGQDSSTLYVSPQVESVLGFTIDEWKADSDLWLRQIHPEDRERVLRDLESSKANEEIFQCEYRMQTRDGRVVWIRDEAVLLRDNDGLPQALQGIMLDITKRKQAEEKERKLIAIVETSSDLIGIADLAGNLVYLNSAGLRLVGIDAFEDVRNTSVRQFHLPEDYHRFETEIMPSILKNGTWAGEIAYRHFKTGAPVPVEMNAFIIRDEETGRPIALANISRDIRQRKDLEAQFLQAQKMEAVGQLAGGIAHDFNNILTAIIGYGNLALLKLEDDHPVRSYVDEMLTSAERAASLTRNLLTFSRRQIIDLRPVTVNSIVERVEQLLLRIIGEDIRLRKVLTPEDTMILADAVQIEHSLVNLATNARDAMPEGGDLTIETDIVEIDEEHVSAYGFSRAGKYVVLSVSDTGEGMEEETRKRAFEPFFTTKEVGKGTGLGMAMVYGSVKQHGGYIGVYSEPGVGTTFKIYLPLYASEAMPLPPAESALVLKGGSETILVAEDDEAIRVLLSSVLKEAGYTVITASDGPEAIAAFSGRAGSISLLLLDVIMPGKNGRQVYEAAKNLNPSVKALLVSGYTADIIEKKGVLEEGLAFISKPVSPVELLRKVRDVLDQQSSTTAD